MTFRLLPFLSDPVRRLSVAGVGLLAVLNGADAVTTRMVLDRTPPGVTEANPLAGVLLATGSLLAVKLAVVAVLGVVVLRSRPRLGVAVTAWAAAGMYLAVVISNLLIWRMLS